jgi:hypothetical protein
MEQTKQLERFVLIDEDALTNFINTKINSCGFEVNIADPLDKFKAELDSALPVIPDSPLSSLL